ncbi:MAG: hypothetical protein OZSIB_3055 [Candidatus Ozemobacter sibiricus]|uniref:Tetratricopeptide repeat protein n=1 Tax=Candidatus Ozemobacter sibiricus TaxID=2268124 RepID=A0A367ZGK8_9BACT|nr:MAG: hypothetical protein OZSIB_3055 [Candidatus Ozemobacter sibiricus]
MEAHLMRDRSPSRTTKAAATFGLLLVMILPVGPTGLAARLSGAPLASFPQADLAERRLDSALIAYEDGYRLYREGNLRAAERRLQEALQHEPNLLKAHYWLGKVYRELGQLKESIFHWEEVIRLQNLIRQRRLALSIQDNEYPAERQIVATRDRQRRAEEAWRKGRGLLEQGHWAGALAELKTAVDLYPGHPEYVKLLARLLWDQGDLQAAARQYGDLLHLPGLPRETALEAIDRLLMVGARLPARRGLRMLLQQFPGDPDLQQRLDAIELATHEEPAAAGRVIRVQRGQAIVDLGLENGLKLADEYTLRLRAFRTGEPVTDPRTGRPLGRAPDRTSGELLVTKVLSRSSWVLIQREFDRGVQEGDLVEVQAGRR